MKLSDNLKPEIKEQAEALKLSIRCDKEYKCLYEETDKLCPAMPFLTLDLLKCDNEERTTCFHSVAYGSLYFCNCEMRMLLEKSK